MSAVTTNFSLDTQPEAFFSTTETNDAVAYAVKTGRARKLGPRLYTKSLSGAPEDICRRNWTAIAAGYFPDAVIAGRTAFAFRPAEDGSVFLSSSQSRDVRVPGLRLRSQRGLRPQDGDAPFMGQNLFMSSRARAFLENLKPSRSRAHSARRSLRRRWRRTVATT